MRLLVSAAFISAAHAETGLASWYEHGRTTANGERFRPDGPTCAHRTARFHSKLKVTVLRTGKSAVCRVNDRGPAKWTGRLIDVSRGTARTLGIIRAGVAKVSVTPVR